MPADGSQSVRIALPSGPTDLDPRFGSINVSSFRVIEQVFRYLVRKDTNSHIVPDLAERWETPDDRTWVFTLRPDVTFHDGSALTSDDVRYTFETVMDSSFSSPLRGAYHNVRAIETPDSLTIIFKLDQPHAPFLVDLILGIVPRHIAESQGRAFGRAPVGCGPFQFAHWQEDQYVELTAYENFYLGRPKVDKLVFQIMPEATTRLFAVKKGDIDLLVNEFPPEYLPQFESVDRVEIRKSSSVIYEYIGMNLGRGPLQQQSVRRAIALAINRQQMLQSLRGGLGESATGLLSPSHWAFAADVEAMGHDPVQARNLLDEAGYPDPDGMGPKVRFTLEYKCANLESSRQKAEAVQHYLAEVGIGVTVKSFEWATFFDDIRNSRFDLYSLQWVGISDPDIYYRLFHSSGDNRNQYKNAELDVLLERGRQTMDRDMRRDIYIQVQQILARDLPYISLWHPLNLTVINRTLNGFVSYPAGDLESLRSVYRPATANR